ncbi:hypothetical protein [Gymnodinialimonas ceratoperidinii]|uniref:Uncharacterized protein n=1 Tax=Gymnodinialimonas ceratoperidinii TaxID=2856823 RepID=A0A8F6TZR9_9RHOB|nr:hypothetical protein [Gymnodinialimonas ceratoperidinii]QXT41149.1 hypothetical protein KYE46_08060 [Gymnodinialimonas ceratoperidinii]
MRISISHHTVRKGFILKTTYYQVHLDVFFSHEELQVIRQRKLAKTKLLDRRPANARVDDRDEKFELRLQDLMRASADTFLCATPSAAKIYEEELLAALAQVKLWIGDNAEVGSRTVVEF